MEISRSLYRSPIGRYLGCFQFGAFRNKAALNAVVHVVSFLLGKFLGVELLCHVIPVCETLSGTVKIPKVLVPFSATISGFQGFQGVPYPCQSRTSRETEREECWDMANEGGVWIGGPWESLGAGQGEREAPGAQAGSCTMWDQMWIQTRSCGTPQLLGNTRVQAERSPLPCQRQLPTPYLHVLPKELHHCLGRLSQSGLPPFYR